MFHWRKDTCSTWQHQEKWSKGANSRIANGSRRKGKKPLKNVKWLEKTREHEAIKDRSIKDVANNSSRRSEGKEGKRIANSAGCFRFLILWY